MKKIATENSPIPLHLVGQPLAISSGHLDAYLSVFTVEALQAVSEKALLNNGLGGGQGGKFRRDGEIGIITISGALQHREDVWSRFFETSTYEQIRNDFKSALQDSSVKAILLDIESPGGEAAGVFDLADEIYQARTQKPVFAFANEYAFSAAYAIAAAASKIYLPRTGQVGSVGVIAVHVDQSGWDEKIGLKYTPIFAGDRKNDFSPHSELSEEAYKSAKASVDKAYGFFVEAVAAYRGIPKQSVIDTQAGLFDGSDAVKAGLADAVMSFEQAKASIRAQISISQTTKVKGKNTMDANEVKGKLSAILEAGDEAEKALAEAGYVPASEAKPDIEKIKAEAFKAGASAELARFAEIFDLCELAGLSDAGVIRGMIADGTSAAEARKKIIDAKAEQDDGRNIRSTHGGLNNGGVNPLVANARKRAGMEG